MRILKLEFENLNSLKGKWSIDFTNPEYKKNHDIFVIHGPTGSGKTTILDAVTLALYGRTPRLPKINNGEGGNEAMTRGTSSCFSKVTYKCKKGEFTSEFSQSKGERSGKLQKAEYRIKNLVSGEEFSGAGSGLEKETEKIIQLDYDQFCRSIMLAQGEFNKFLASDSRKRSEILEKLNGSERFREIGARVAAKFLDEVKPAFELLQNQKNEKAALILSEDEEKSVRESDSLLSEKIEENSRRLEKTMAELNHYEEFRRLKKEVDEAKILDERISAQIKAFGPNEKRLERAGNAKNCEVDYASFSKFSDDLKKNREESESLKGKIARNDAECSESGQIAEENQKKLADGEKNLAVQQEIWKEVRELDTKILNEEKVLADTEKRKTEIEKIFSSNNSEMTRLSAELKNLNSSIEEISDYLEKNKKNEGLADALVKIDTIKKSLNEGKGQIEKFSLEKENFEREEKNIQERLSLAKSELEKVDEEIKAFVSGDSIFIARLLQRELSDGNPCPVCGSVYHSSHEMPLFDSLPEETDGEKAVKIAGESKNLTEKREKILSSVQGLSSNLEKTKANSENAGKNLDSAKKSLSGRLDEINSVLLPWEKSVKIENLSALDEIFSALSQDAKKWAEQSKNLVEFKNSKSEKEGKFHALESTLGENKKQLESVLSEFEANGKILENHRAEREKIFGNKSVDASENEMKARLDSLKEASENAEKRRQALEVEKSALKAKKEQIEQNISVLEPKFDESKEKFSSILQKNGFSSADEFLAARMPDDEFASLERRREELKNEGIKAKTSLKNKEKSYDDYQKSHKLERLEEEVRAEIESLKQTDRESKEKLLEVKQRLNLNEQNKSDYEKIKSEYEEKSKEYQTWLQMDGFIGKRDGSDLSKFVQSLSVGPLLRLTNSNLYGITGRYRIVQKTPGELDFEIEDVVLSEKRSVENLSGGEKFIVSLSFALGISEFASQNVSVDSLFLDEGFGTLSGEPLFEAINALKNLQKDGKMLGIITHVESVINEIDQKIEVKPLSNGYSRLSGDGITEG